MHHVRCEVQSSKSRVQRAEVLSRAASRGVPPRLETLEVQGSKFKVQSPPFNYLAGVASVPGAPPVRSAIPLDPSAPRPLAPSIPRSLGPSVPTPRGFTLIELLVVISIIALLIGILLPALGAARATARKVQNATQLRGIQQGMVTYANSNNGWYPGLNGYGQSQPVNTGSPTYKAAVDSDDPATNDRVSSDAIWATMLNGNYFTPKYIISPGETSSQVKAVDRTAATPTVNLYNDSYGLEAIDHASDAGRRLEWKNTLNASAPVISDRGKEAAGNDPSDAYLTTTSIWSKSTTSAKTNPDDWSGDVVWNDNHVQRYSSATMTATRFGQTTNSNDNLFDYNGTSSGSDNACISYRR